MLSSEKRIVPGLFRALSLTGQRSSSGVALRAAQPGRRANLFARRRTHNLRQVRVLPL